MHAATGTTTHIFHNVMILLVYNMRMTQIHITSVRRAAKKDVNFIEGLVGVGWLGWMGSVFRLCATWGG